MLQIWVSLLIFALPLLFVPSLFNVYQWPKSIFLLVGTLIGLIMALGQGWRGQRFSFGKTKKLVFPLLFLWLVFMASAFWQPNATMRLNALRWPVVTVSFGILLTFLVSLLPNKKWPIYSFIGSSFVLAIIAILQYAGLLSKWFSWPPLKQAVWTPTGSILVTLVMLAVAIAYLVAELVKNIRQDQPSVKESLFIIGSLVVLLLGLVLGTLSLIKAKPFYISPTVSWVVAVETMKNLKNTLLGVGPGNFGLAFQRFRPATVNNSEAWNYYFNASFNQYLNLFTEVGILGLWAFLWLVFYLFREKKELIKKGSLFVALAVLLVLSLMVSFDLQLWALFFVLLGALHQVETKPDQSKLMRYLNRGLLFVFLLVLAVVIYVYGRIIWADVLFAKSMAAFNRGEGGNAYNLQIKALQKNSRVDTYHLAYAQTSLALADSFSRQENLSDQDKQKITILIQQAIREGKAAAAQNPLKSNNWEALGNIYRRIIGVAQGADQWAIEALRQAVVLDPVNPELRISLGGLYFARKDYDSAQRQFEMAVNLKPDHANAHYNLAAVYKAQEKWAKAALELKTVLSLIDSQSADFDSVQKELAEVQKNLPKPEQQEGSGQQQTQTQLQPPQESLPTPSVSPIELPEEAAPEVPAPEETAQPGEELPTEAPVEEITPSPQP